MFPCDEPSALRTRRALWLADGLFDQFVRLLLEDLEASKRQGLVERTWRKIEAGLDALNEDARGWMHARAIAAQEQHQHQHQNKHKQQQPLPPQLDVAQVRAACTLDFISRRPAPSRLAGAGDDWSWRDGREELAAWFDSTHCLTLFQRHLADQP